MSAEAVIAGLVGLFLFGLWWAERQATKHRRDHPELYHLPEAERELQKRWENEQARAEARRDQNYPR